jgi:TonB family protein
MRKSIIITLAVLCAAPLAQAQTESPKQSPQKSAPATLSNASSDAPGSLIPFKMTSQEVYDVGKRLKDGSDIPIQFEPDKQSPVTIKKAVVRSVTHEVSGTSQHLIEPRIKLVNETKQVVTAVRLEFTLADEEDKSLGYTFTVVILPGESKLLSSDPEYVPPFLLAPGSPEKLKVRVVGVEFGNIRVWGILPASQNMILVDTAVDKKPVVLNRPRPNYTERARRNGVQGSVTMRVLIDEKGAVSRVKVLEGLPDGLTEQALKAAYQLKFKPAMKDGKPVPYWVGLTMDFNLK